MNMVATYLRLQLGYLIFLFLFFVLPLLLFFQFSHYPLPKVQYVFLGSLILTQYIFYNEKSSRRKSEPQIFKMLQRELERLPSRKEVTKRQTLYTSYRSVSILLTGLSIFLVMVYFQEF